MKRACSSWMACGKGGTKVEDAAVEMEGGLPFRCGSSSVELVTEIPDIRIERISRLRRSIAEGSYHISAAELARKLIWHIQCLS